MATFILETYLSRSAEGEPDRTIARTMAAVVELEASGEVIRYLRSIYVPDDEICLLLFEAGSADAVSLAAARAGLDPDRIALADSRELATRG
jgi:hypothetical protein